MQSSSGHLSPHQRQYLYTDVNTFKYTSRLHSDTNILVLSLKFLSLEEHASVISDENQDYYL